MKKRIKMYGGKPPKPITSTGDSAPTDAPKTKKLGFWAKRKTKKISKETIHIAKEISKLKGNIEISKAKKPPGTYVSKEKQSKINKLIGDLGKLSAKSAEIHKENILKETQSPKQGEPSKALESPQTQRANTKLQSAFQTKVESDLAQKQFNSQTMYRSKQKYINSTKEALSIEREKLLGEKAKLDSKILKEKEEEKTKPQGEPNKPGFFSKISSLFKMKKKTTKNKLNNVQSKLNNLTKTQNSIDKYEREQNNAYYAKQDNYAERLKILKTIPTATAKSNVPTTQTASTKAQTASTKLQQQPPKNKKQAEKQIAETHKIVEGETIKLREATEKIDEIDTKIASVKADYLKSIEELAKINLELDRVSTIDKNLDTKLEALQKKIDSNTLGQTSKEFDEYKELKAESMIIKSKIEINKGKQRVADKKANTELIKEQNLQIEKEAAITIEKEAQKKVQEAENTLTQAAINLNKLSKTKKERQADKKQKEANAAKKKEEEEEDAKIKAKQEANAATLKAEQAAAAEKDRLAEEAKKKANEAFKKTLPGLQKKRKDIAKNLEELKSKKIEAEGAFNVAKQNKNDADEIVRSQREELNYIRTKNKNNFKTEYAIKFPGASLTGEIYLKAQEKYINEIETYNPVVRNKILDLEISKKEANKYKEKFEEKSKNKNYYLVQIKNTKTELAILDTQITNFNIIKPTNTGSNNI